MRKYFLITGFIFLMSLSSCKNGAATTSLIEPTKTSSPSVDANTSTPTDTSFVKTVVSSTATPSNLSKELTNLQPINQENIEKVGLFVTLEIPSYSPRTASQCDVVFSPNGSLLVGTCGANPIPVWDVQSGRLLYQLYPDEYKQIVVCDFSPDGSKIACGGVDKIITIWNAATGEKISEFGEHNSKIWDLEFSPDGMSLVTASFAHDLRLWDITSQEMIWSYHNITNFLSVAYHPSADEIAYGNLWGMIGIIDTNTGERLVELIGPSGTPVGDVNFSASGKFLAAGSDDNKIYLWNAEDYQPLASLDGHEGFVNGVYFSPDEQLLISGSHDKTVGIWDIGEQQLLRKLEAHQKAVLRVTFNPTGTLIASISWDGTVCLWGVVEE
ncbi:MAG: WD40 repeat domain-containing protein [Anaerolineales bacterium]|nr:WD40 repeat domain-containing protein [Anaerolineales bacterium]